MTTGRINQVCRVLLETCRPCNHGYNKPQQQKCNCSQLKSHASKLFETPPSKRNLQLDTSMLHLSAIKMKALRHKQPAHTQRTVCYQAVAQYPKSFNIHKETPRLTPKRKRHCTRAHSICRPMLDASTS